VSYRTKARAAQTAVEFSGREVDEKESQATSLVNLVLDRCKVVHDENSEVYAIDRVTGEVRHIERRAFKHWLTAAFYESSGKSARSQAFAEALQTLGGLGRHNGTQEEVHIRCAAHDGGYVIDLGQHGNSLAFIVQPGKWQLVSYSGVLFVRPESMRPLPIPVQGGTGPFKLWDLVNVPEPSRLLVLTWLLDCLRPDTPFPLLELIGEQGSAKSVTQSLLRELIDPSTVDLRSAPKNSEDVYVGAANGWLLAYDNISHMSADLQDTLCRVSTGGAHATRKLHTNTEESSIRAKRPVSINGISAAVTAQDLVDRTISVEIPVLQDRRERRAIEKAFREEHGALLGALLDLFAAALDKLAFLQIPPHRRPRMLEYATLGCAVARALGCPDEAFLNAYEASRAESIARTLDASPVATALLDWVEAAPGRFGEHSIKALFAGVEDWKPHGCEAWPRSAKGFADALRRAAPALRSQGVEISRGRKSDGQTLVTIARKSRSEVTDVTEVTEGDRMRLPGGQGP
jgi:hypothetical protein